MKKISVFICVYLWLTFSCFSIFAQDYKTLQNGIEYAEVTREIDKLPVKMNLLRLDLTKVRLDVVHAKDAAIGLEKTSSIAMRHGAFAAINAGFFRIDKSIWEGDDVSTLMIDKKLLSESKNERISLIISNMSHKTEVNFAHLKVDYMVRIGNNSVLEISGVNRQLGKDEIVIYTPDFQRTTLTNSDVIEIIVKEGIVTQILEHGSNMIPSNGLVLSVSGEKKKLIKAIKVGVKINTTYIRPFPMWDDESDIEREAKKRDPLAEISDKHFNEAEDIVSGVPQLIKNGKIEITWEQEKSSKSFVETKHPRTAVAKLKDGKFLMVTVDGRSESSGGISLQSLAEILLEFGAIDAMNLDGGGSTTMFLDGKIVNKPSDKEGERSVGDAILVFPRK